MNRALNIPQKQCDSSCQNILRKEAVIVTDLDESKNMLMAKSTIASLVNVLNCRADRLVQSQVVRFKLKATIQNFICNIITYFHETDQLDDYTLVNIMTALSTADNHYQASCCVEDYSTFIRKLNPTDEDADRYFIIGREGRITDKNCPLRSLENDPEELNKIPIQKLHVYKAFFYSRQHDISRGAPRIPIEEFVKLIPVEVKSNPDIEEAFLDVCFSDGAWELYQHRIAS